MNRFVLWDLDGTLVDSGTDIVNAANAARVALGFQALPHDTVRSFVGEGAAKLIEYTLGAEAAERHAEAYATFLRLYAADLVTHTRPYEGIDAIVRALSRRQSVTTNKPGEMARRMIAHFEWEAHFHSVLGADDVPNKKPAPDMIHRALELAGVSPRDAVLVGDTTIDIGAARAAGIDVIAVEWGLRPGEDLSAATRCVKTTEELAAALGL